MNDIIIKTAELALIRALPGFLIDDLKKPSRIKGLFEKLINRVDTEIAKLPYLNSREMLQVKSMMEKFGKETGWQHKRKHIMTYVSFLLTMIDGRYPKIEEILNHIVDFHERGKDLKPICCHAGGLAFEKWIKIKGCLGRR